MTALKLRDEDERMIVDPACVEHGWIGHAAVREAGRAAAAIEIGVPFERVAVSWPDDWHPPSDPKRFGGLRLVSAFADWARTEIVEAFQFVVTGAMSERAILGHNLTQWWEYDLSAFRRAIGLTHAVAREEFDVVLGESAWEILLEIEQWALENEPRIRSLAWVLAGVPPSDDVQVIQLREDHGLAASEVAEMLDRTAHEE